MASTILISLGLLLLFHSGYSVHELTSTPNPSPALSKDTPPDIVLETLVSLVLLSVGYVLRMSELKPIIWRKWAGGLERRGEMHAFRSLETRVGFVDIRRKREEFSRWMRDDGVQEVGQTNLALE